MSENVVGNLGDQPLTIVAGDSGLARELDTDVVDDTFAKSKRIHAGVEKLGSELADDGEVDPVLDVGEWVGPRCLGDRPVGRESLV